MIQRQQNQRIIQERMDFLLNPNPLPIGPTRKSNEYQYYVWQHKQTVLEQKKQQNSLKKMLEDIEDEEKKQQNKKYTKKKKPHFVGTFYDYNLEWKNKVDEKVKIDQMIKEQEKQRVEEENMIPQKSFDKRDMSIFYRGPIEGWQEHFNQYLRRKTNKGSLEDEGITFHPKINARSKKIAQQLTGKVEDRLIVFGQMQKMRQKQEQFTKRSTNSKTFNENHNNYSFNFSNGNQSNAHSSISDAFTRLYREGEELSKRKKQQQLKQQHSFQPKLNKLPQQIEDRIMKNRKPLYYIKNSLSQMNSCQQSNTPAQVQKKKGNFKLFMERNQILLNNRNKMSIIKNEMMQNKENKQRSQCTFSPNLNKKSMKIYEMNKRNNKTFEQKILCNISSQFLTDPKDIKNQMRDQINLSKVTVGQHRMDSSYDDSDSLSKIIPDTSTKKTKRKYMFHEQGNYDGHEIVQEEEEDQKEDKIQLNEKSQELKYSKLSKQLTISDKKIGNTGTQDITITGELEEDSIEKMKDQQWEAQLSQIQSHLENMMARAGKFD